MENWERGVQELVRNQIKEPPNLYIRKEGERPVKASPLPASSIPTVDLQLLFSSGEAKEVEMKKLGSALQTWGFFQAVGHGIPDSLLDAVDELSSEFFKLSFEDKTKLSKVFVENPDHESLEGYGVDNLGSDQKIFDWNDRLYLLVLPEDERKFKFWPENPAAFRKILHEYTMNVKEITDQILQAMAEFLSLDENYFIHRFGERATMHARFCYYPPCARPDLVFGLRPHTDVPGLTILLQDQRVNGLQLLKDDDWMDIPIIPHALLYNIGDQMEIMSNGIFKSPVHRVVTNPDKERRTLTFFYAPEEEGEIEPAEGLISKERPKLYKKMTVKDYMAAFVENYKHGKRAIDCAKISPPHA